MFTAMHCHHYLATHSALLLGRPDKLCFMQFPRNWGNARPGFSILKVIFSKFVLVLLSTINCKGIQSNDFCWKVQRIKILILHFEPFSLCKLFEIDLKGGRIKDQLISKANFEVFIWSKNWTKYFCISALASKKA